MPEFDFVSRSEAKARKLKRYYTGGTCKHGHRAERFVSTGACVACGAGKPADPPEAEQRRMRNDFKWSDDIREVLIDEYVNTGDIQGAREVVHCSAAAYHRELEANPEFAAAIKKATVLAMQTLEDRAIHQAGKGNDKLILAVLKAKHPDQYSERIKVDTSHTVKLSDAELDRRIRRLGGGHIIDGISGAVDIPALPEHPRRIDIARREARITQIAGGAKAEDGAN